VSGVLVLVKVLVLAHDMLVHKSSGIHGHGCD
jgi:hypothetical protein